MLYISLISVITREQAPDDGVEAMPLTFDADIASSPALITMACAQMYCAGRLLATDVSLGVSGRRRIVADDDRACHRPRQLRRMPRRHCRLKRRRRAGVISALAVGSMFDKRRRTVRPNRRRAATPASSPSARVARSSLPCLLRKSQSAVIAD